MVTTRAHTDPATTLEGQVIGLKEWGAAIHALLRGRQTILLRKGGIHEKAFARPAEGGGFVLFPTVAHSHRERTRPEHRDLLPLGEADVHDDHVVVRAGITVHRVIDVARPEGLPQLSDLHIWTDESIATDRVAFRPAKPLQVLVVQAVALPQAVGLPRIPSYGGCRSWIDLTMAWDGSGQPVHDSARLAVDADRVRAAVGG